MRVDTASSDIKVELADGDAHTSDTEITKTKDTRAICDYEDLWLVWQISGILLEDFGDVVLVKFGGVSAASCWRRCV